MYELTQNLEQKINPETFKDPKDDNIIIKMIYNLFDKSMLKKNELIENSDFDEEIYTTILINKIIELSEIKEINKENKKENKNEDTSPLFTSLKTYVDFYKIILTQISTNLLNEINNVLELLKINSVLIEIAEEVKQKDPTIAAEQQQ